MPVDPEIMADVRRANGRSRWGGTLKPRALGAEHVTTALNRYSLRRLDGHGASKDVSLLGIGSKKRDSEQLQLESLFAEFQQLKIEKERLERDDVPSEKCSQRAIARLGHDWTSGVVSGNAVTWGLAEPEDAVRSSDMSGNCAGPEVELELEPKTEPEPEPKPEPEMTTGDAMQHSVVDDFGEILRQHSMTPAQRRPALPVPKSTRSTSVDLPARRAPGRCADRSCSLSNSVSIHSEERMGRSGRDSVDHWLLSELALADSETKSRRQSQSESEAEPSGVRLELGPMTKWLRSLGLQRHTQRVLSMLPKVAVDAMTDEADCQFYFEDLVRTKQGLAEVRSLCKACRMLASEEAKLLRAVRAAATASHIPSAPNHDRTTHLQNTQVPKPGRAAREAIKWRSVSTETQGRQVSLTRSGLARSNKAADLRANKSHSVPSTVVARDVAVAQNVISVRCCAPFSSVLLKELSATEAIRGSADSTNNTMRVDRVLRDVAAHSDLASEVLENGRQLLKLQELRRQREAERAAAEAATRKRLLEQHMTDLQINI